MWDNDDNDNDEDVSANNNSNINKIMISYQTIPETIINDDNDDG
jgi:hypothetical protein